MNDGDAQRQSSAAAKLDARLRREVETAQMTAAQADEVRRQFERFEQQRTEIERDLRFRVVCFVAGERIVGDSVSAVVDEAKARFPGRMFYAETVGFDALGSVGSL
ncbi:MAG TPA: hypothetical protein VFF00_00045 [Candidatus Elarobacter sp.]|nr:hypothetical protein [Candidatus Elarobacter sp.]